MVLKPKQNKTMKKRMNELTVSLLGAGGFVKWACDEALRLSKLPTFQAGGWNPIGYSSAWRSLIKKLRKVDFPDAEGAARDIFKMAQLIASSNKPI